VEVFYLTKYGISQAISDAKEIQDFQHNTLIAYEAPEKYDIIAPVLV